MKDGLRSTADGPRSAGQILRQRREAAGLDLAEAAATLRIKPAYLAALEAGRPELLPGPIYAVGFLRAYADHLGLDSGEVLRRFKAEAAGLADKPDLAFPVPLGERSMPGGGTLIVAVILAICGYGIWYYMATGENSRPERVAEVPAELLQTRPALSPSAEAVAAPRAPASIDGARAEAGSESAGSSAPAPAISTAVSQSETRTVSAGVKPAAANNVSGPPRIVIRAIADSWVQIRGPGGWLLLTRVLKAGESYALPDQPGLLLRTGNAGGLEITVNGAPAPAIGRAGMVRRDVALDATALLAGGAVRD